MKAIYYQTLIISLFFLPWNTGYSQITATLPAWSGCPGQVDIPVEVQGFTNVASVSLKINYDTSILQYVNHSGLHTALTQGVFLINAIHQQVILSWFSLNPANIGDGTLISLHFLHKKNAPTTLAWDTAVLGNCVFTDIDGTVIPTLFTDAVITPVFVSPGLLLPANGATLVSENPLLQWNGSNCAPLYELSYGSDPDFIANTTTITGIFGTSKALTGLNFSTLYFWKVRASTQSPAFQTAWSQVFSFTTRGPDAIHETPDPVLQNVKIYPNPVQGAAILHFELQKFSNIGITLFETRGGNVKSVYNGTLPPGKHAYPIDLHEVAPGSYFLRVSYVQEGRAGFQNVTFLSTQ